MDKNGLRIDEYGCVIDKNGCVKYVRDCEVNVQYRFQIRELLLKKINQNLRIGREEPLQDANFSECKVEASVLLTACHIALSYANFTILKPQRSQKGKEWISPILGALVEFQAQSGAIPLRDSHANYDYEGAKKFLEEFQDYMKQLA